VGSYPIHPIQYLLEEDLRCACTSKETYAHAFACINLTDHRVVRYGYKADITLNPRNEMQDTAKGEVENLRAPPGGQP
jgi:hypothetical protein